MTIHWLIQDFVIDEAKTKMDDTFAAQASIRDMFCPQIEGIFYLS